MIADLIAQYGYLIVLLITFSEMIFFLGPIIPGGNTFLILIGYLSTITNLNIFVCAFAAFIGTVSGNHISYLLGKKGGKKYLERDTFIYSKESFDKFKIFFETHGIKTILIGRPIFLLRQFHAVTAGAGSMNTKKFIKYNIIGAVIWIFIFLSIGWIVGIFFKDKVSYDDVKGWVDQVVITFTVITILGFLLGFLFNKFKKKVKSLK